MTTITLSIPGKPFAWQRARQRGVVHFESKEQKSWKALAQAYMIQAIVGKPRPVFPDQAVDLTIIAYWPMKGQPLKRGRRPSEMKPTRPDADNIAKAFMDASQGLLVTDDAQYAEVYVAKYHAAQDEGARMDITVEEVV